MTGIRYTDDHEWIKQESDGVSVVGITDYAQDKLGDVVYIELPELGRKISRGEEVCVIESVKAAADVKAPVSGEVIAVNQAIADDPALVNRDPMGSAWFFKVRLTDPNEVVKLLDETAYADLTKA